MSEPTSAAQRLLELKKKLLSSSKPQPVVASSPEQSPLPQPAPRPLVSPSDGASESRRESLESSASTKESGGKKKQPLTLRSLMGQRKKSAPETEPPPVAPVQTGSRLKEAPAHRAASQMAETKTNLIRSKVISLTKDSSSSVAEKIAHFEQNPPPGLLLGPAPVDLPKASIPASSLTTTNHPFATFIHTQPKQREALPVEATVSVSHHIPEDYGGVVNFIQNQRLWLKRHARESGLQITNTKRIKSPENVTAFIEEHKRFLEALVVIK
jgi:hypothetical protein